MTTAIYRGVRLRDEIIFFPIAGEIIDYIGHASFFDFLIRRFDKTEFVDARESRHRTDEADVRSFWRFNWANAAVVRRMHVAHFEPSAITRQTTRPESRKTAFVRQLCERICLIHELRKLRATEEIPD